MTSDEIVVLFSNQKDELLINYVSQELKNQGIEHTFISEGSKLIRHIGIKVMAHDYDKAIVIASDLNAITKDSLLQKINHKEIEKVGPKKLLFNREIITIITLIGAVILVSLVLLK